MVSQKRRKALFLWRADSLNSRITAIPASSAAVWDRTLSKEIADVPTAFAARMRESLLTTNKT